VWQSQQAQRCLEQGNSDQKCVPKHDTIVLLTKQLTATFQQDGADLHYQSEVHIFLNFTFLNRWRAIVYSKFAGNRRSTSPATSRKHVARDSVCVSWTADDALSVITCTATEAGSLKLKSILRSSNCLSLGTAIVSECLSLMGIRVIS